MNDRYTGRHIGGVYVPVSDRERIARTLELKEETGEAVVKYLFDLNSRINIPHRLSAIGVKQEHIETLSDLALADFAHPNNPKPLSREDFRQLYTRAL